MVHLVVASIQPESFPDILYDKPHLQGQKEKLKIFLAKPTGMFRDSDVNRIGTNRMIGIHQEHVDSESALTMNSHDGRVSLHRFHFVFQCRVGFNEFIPLDMTTVSRIGEGVDNVQKTLQHWVRSW